MQKLEKEVPGIAVIGSGFAGISAATYLAKQGYMGRFEDYQFADIWNIKKVIISVILLLITTLTKGMLTDWQSRSGSSTIDYFRKRSSSATHKIPK